MATTDDKKPTSTEKSTPDSGSKKLGDMQQVAPNKAADVGPPEGEEPQELTPEQKEKQKTDSRMAAEADKSPLLQHFLDAQRLMLTYIIKHGDVVDHAAASKLLANHNDIEDGMKEAKMGAVMPRPGVLQPGTEADRKMSDSTNPSSQENKDPRAAGKPIEEKNQTPGKTPEKK